MTGGTQGAFEVHVRRIHFGFDGVTGSASAQPRPRCRTSAVGITALHHEVFDDPVEQQIVVEPFLHEFDEIVPVRRGIVKQLDGHRTEARLQRDTGGPVFRSASGLARCTSGKEQGECTHPKGQFQFLHGLILPDQFTTIPTPQPHSSCAMRNVLQWASTMCQMSGE